jgi:hypothetical protein
MLWAILDCAGVLSYWNLIRTPTLELSETPTIPPPPKDEKSAGISAGMKVITTPPFTLEKQ